jgi:hypothetical protein
MPMMTPPALAMAMALLSLAAGSPPDLSSERAALRSEVEKVRAEMASYEDGPVDRYERPQYRQGRERLWTLVERWTLGYLDAHPDADAGAITADLATLAGKQEWFTPSAVRLAGKRSGNHSAVVVSLEAGFSGGTFFIVAPTPARRFAVAWSIRPVAEMNYAFGNELGAWAFLVPAVHDGPLGGRVLPLPPTRTGRPRFLIDAITHAGMGMEVPAQLSVWEWTGNQAVQELIKSYRTTYDVHSIKRAGDLLKAADDLLSRVARGEDASALAAPGVIGELDELVRSLREDLQERERDRDPRETAKEPPDPYDGLRSMLGSWRISPAGSRRALDLDTDDWHLVLTFEKRAGTDYATAVAFP